MPDMGSKLPAAAATFSLTLAAVLAGSGLVARPALAGGGCHRDLAGGAVEASGSTVELAGACMNPAVLRVDVGTTVTFVNRDEVLHDLYGSGFAAGDLRPGQEATFRFDDAGTFAYACTLHPGMVGAIAVGDGHRVGDGGPVDIEPVMARTTTTSTTAAPVPVVATTPLPADQGDEGVPVALAIAGAAVAAALAFGAGARRRAATT
jgi:plastocyanin